MNVFVIMHKKPCRRRTAKRKHRRRLHAAEFDVGDFADRRGPILAEEFSDGGESRSACDSDDVHGSVLVPLKNARIGPHAGDAAPSPPIWSTIRITLSAW